MQKRVIIISVAVALLGTLLYGILRLTMYKYIQPDEIGIWMTNGGKNGPADYQVWTGHFPIDFNPLTKSFILPAYPWSVDLAPYTVLSKENGEWSVDPSFTFSVERLSSPSVCHNYNNLTKQGKDKFLENVGEHILTPIVRNVFTEVLGANRDTFMMSEKMLVARIIEDSVRIQFARHGYLLQNFVTGITPPQSILETNRAKNEAQQAVFKARADVEKANAQAVVQVATAKANAEAMLVGARAQAEAIRLEQQTLTPLVLQRMWIETWDGKLPTYLGPGVDLMISGQK